MNTNQWSKTTSVTLRSALLALVLWPLAACGHHVVGWPIDDHTGPTITSTDPIAHAMNVPLAKTVVAIFDKALDPRTVSATTFTLTSGTSAVPGIVTYTDVTARFAPVQPLAANTVYTAHITTGVTDLAGNPMLADYSWTFTTVTPPDTIAPQVTSTMPVNGALMVANNVAITATFTEAMNVSSVTTSFSLMNGSLPIGAVVTHTGVVATLTPNSALADSTTYTARISALATDVAGNHLAQDYIWSFTTGVTPDTTPPTVTATVPAMSAINVAQNAFLTATFSEPISAATITSSSFTLGSGTTPVTGIVTYSGVTAMFAPSTTLLPNTTYTATITIAVTDLAGNPMAAPFTWSFATGPTPDVTRPSVTLTVPADDATGVALGGAIEAVFTEPMDPGTINVANFTVQEADTRITGTVTYTGVTATFHPSMPLSPDTVYSAVVTTGAQDLAGNALARNYVWNFLTGLAADTTRPTVVSTIPADLATNVALNSNLTVTFDEAMDPLTLTSASFTLLDGATVLAGIVTSIGATATLDPTLDLTPSTTYTATITTAATDLAGNALLTAHVWTFTTGAAPDAIAPTVVLVNPADLATLVSVNASVNATFSEAMAPLSVTTATFTLQGPGSTDVVGTVAYAPITFIGTFTPQNPLLPFTTYTATVTTGATDLAANPLAMNKVWTFTTGVTPSGLRPVNLRSLSTFVAVAGAGLTNSNSGGSTTLNGDVGLSPTGSCLGDGSPCSAIDPIINGTLYVNDPAGVAAQAKVDLTAAYVDAMSRPVGTTVNDISGMVLAQGVYTSGSTMSIAVGGTVTLDGQGDSSAVWIFQIGSSLTVNNGAHVLLINGASAKNVFWAAFASTTLGSNVSFEGNVLAGSSNSVGTGSTVVGRLLCTTGAISLLSDTITLPPL